MKRKEVKHRERFKSSKLYQYFFNLNTDERLTITAIVFIFGLVAVGYLAFRTKPVNPLSIDMSIYHKPGSNNSSAIEKAEWIMVYRLGDKTGTFPGFGRIKVSPDEYAIYEDQGCVFSISWDTEPGGTIDSSYEKNKEIWDKTAGRIKDDDFEVVGFVRIYKGKRRVFKFCNNKERIQLTRPEETDQIDNIWQFTSNPTPMPTPLLFSPR